MLVKNIPTRCFFTNENTRVSLRQGKGDDVGEINNGERTDDVTFIKTFSRNFPFELNAFDKDRRSYFDLNDKTYKALHENQSTAFIHITPEEDTIVSNTTDNGVDDYITPLDNDIYSVMSIVDNINTETVDILKETAYQQLHGAFLHAKHEEDTTVSNTTYDGVNDYITPVDDETCTVIINVDDTKTETDDINKENAYLQFDGADCDDTYGGKNDGYMTWDVGNIRCDDDPSGNNIVRTTATNIGGNLFNEYGKNKVGNSRLKEEYLVNWTSDGARRLESRCDNQEQGTGDYSVPYDFLKKNLK